VVENGLNGDYYCEPPDYGLEPGEVWV